MDRQGEIQREREGETDRYSETVMGRQTDTVRQPGVIDRCSKTGRERHIQ